MSCRQCNIAQNKGWVAYYRWGTADIAISGCPEHIKQVIEALNKAQKGGLSGQTTQNRQG